MILIIKNADYNRHNAEKDINYQLYENCIATLGAPCMEMESQDHAQIFFQDSTWSNMDTYNNYQLKKIARL